MSQIWNTYQNQISRIMWKTVTFIHEQLIKSTHRYTRTWQIPKFAYETTIGHISTIMKASERDNHCYYYDPHLLLFYNWGFWAKPYNYKESLELQRATCNEVSQFLPRSQIMIYFTKTHSCNRERSNATRSALQFVNLLIILVFD